MNRHSHWSDQLGQAQRPAFQAVSVVWLGGGGVAAALRAACRLKPAVQAVPALQVGSA